MYGDSERTDYDARRRAEEAMKAANKVTAILCLILRRADPEFIKSLGPEVVEWMEQHRAHDEAHGRKW